MPSMQSSEIQYKASAGTFNLDEALGIVECFVAGIGNKDSVGDVCATGAFAKSLLRRKPRVVWGHNWNDPIGKVLDIYEVPASDPRLPIKMKMAGIGGLYAKVQFNLQSEKGKEAFANVAFFGEEQEWSIGYKTLRAQYDQNMQANILHEVELYEVSPVLHGANQLTGTISVKTDGTGQDVMERVVFPSGQMQEATNVRPLTAPVETPSPEDELLQKMVAELEKRTASKIKIVSLEKDSVIFDRQTSDGVVSKYKCGYHHDGREFMFGQPQRIVIQKPNINPPMMSPQQGQPSPQNRVTKPVPVMPMPVAIRPGQSGPVSIPLPVVVYEDSSNNKPKVPKPLDNEERALADALVRITKKYGKFNEDKKGVYAAYTPAAENELVDIGVKCSNCVFFKGEGSCRIIDKAVEADGRCRFAVIPPGVVGGTAMDKKDYNDFLDEQEVKWVEDIEEKYPGEFIFAVLRNAVKKRRRKRRKYKELNEFDAEEYAIKEKTLGNQEEKFFYIPVDVENLFEVKSLLDPVLDYHRVDSFVDEYGVVLTSGITEEFVDAVEIAVKGIGTRIGKRIGSGLIDRPRIGSGRKKNNNRLGGGRIDISTGGTRGTRKPTGTDKDIDRDGWVDEGTTNPRWIGMSSGANAAPERTPKKLSSGAIPLPSPRTDRDTAIPLPSPRTDRDTAIPMPSPTDRIAKPLPQKKKRPSADARHRSAKLLKNPAEDAKEADFEKITSSWREQGLGWVEIPRYAADKKLSNDFLRGRELGYNQVRVMWEGLGTYKRPANFNEKAKSSIDYRGWFWNTAKTSGQYMENNLFKNLKDKDTYEVDMGALAGISEFFTSIKPNVTSLGVDETRVFFEILDGFGFPNAQGNKNSKLSSGKITQSELDNFFPNLKEQLDNVFPEIATRKNRVPFPEAKPKRVSKQQRDDEKIYKRRNDGESLADVAESLGLSREEVRKREQRHMRRLRKEEGERLSEDSNRSGEKLSSGGKRWVELAKEEAGNNPKDLANFLIEKEILEEDHPMIKKLRDNRTNDAEYENAFEMLATLDEEDWLEENDFSEADRYDYRAARAARKGPKKLSSGRREYEDKSKTSVKNMPADVRAFLDERIAFVKQNIGKDSGVAKLYEKLRDGFELDAKERDSIIDSLDRIEKTSTQDNRAYTPGQRASARRLNALLNRDNPNFRAPKGTKLDDLGLSDEAFVRTNEINFTAGINPNNPRTRPAGGKLSSGRKKKGKASKRKPFSSEDRQRFADGDRLRARTIPGKKKPGPSVDEFKLSSGYGGGSRQDRRNASLLKAQRDAREEEAIIESDNIKKTAIEVIKSIQGGTPSPNGTYDDLTPKSKRLKKIQERLAKSSTPALVGTLADNKKRKPDGPWMLSFAQLRPLLKNENNEPLSDAQIKFAFNLDDAELKKLTGKDGAISSAAVEEFMDAHGYPTLGVPGESSAAIRAIWGFDSSPYWYDKLEDDKLMNRDEYEAASNESAFLFYVQGLDSPQELENSYEPDVLPKKREVIAPAVTKRSIEGTKGSDSQGIYAIDTLLESLGLKDKTPEEVAEAFTELLGAKTTASQIFSSSKSWKNKGVPTNVTLQLKKNGHIPSAKDVFQNDEAEALDRSVEQNKFYSALYALLKKNGIEIDRGAGNISDGAMGQILGEAIGDKPLISVKRAFEKASDNAAGTFSYGVGAAIVWTPEEIQRTLDGVNKKTGKNFKIDDLKLSSGKFGKGERKISPRLSSGADRKFREINDKKIYDWDELSDNQKEDLIDLLGQKYVYEKLGLTDDAGIDAIDDGKYSEEIAEYTEDWYASTMRAFRKSGARGWQVNQQINKMDDRVSKTRVKKNPLDKIEDGERLSSGKLDEVYKSITQKLITAIESADGDKWEAPWYKVGAFPKNPTTNRPYSNTNLLFLLMAQEDKGYTKPYWATYKQWEKAGAQVKGGEKGTKILVPRTYKEKEDADGNKKEGGVFYSVASVFNIDQVDGAKIEEIENKFPKLSEEQRVSQLESAIKEIGAKITEAASDRAYYSPSKDEIVLPKFENFKSPLDFYATQAHELMHWTGHTSRLNRPNMNYFGSPEYAYEELVAEIASAFFMASHGLSAEPQPQHAMYLASWLKRLKSDPDALQKAVSDAQKAVNFAIKLSPSMSKRMAISENVDDVPGITIPETSGKLSSGKTPDLPAINRALESAGLAESVADNMITEALSVWKDNPSLHEQYIERLDGDINGAVFSLYNDYLEDMFDRSPEGTAKIERELNEQYEAERSLSSGRPSKRLSRRAKDNESSKLSSGKQPWDDSDVQKRLIDGARTKKKTKADGKTESFMASMVRQFDAGRKLNDNQWKPLWENFGTKNSGESTGKPDAPSATKKTRTKFSGTKRKIIDLKDVEKYDYPKLPANRKPTVEQGAAIDAMMTGDDVKIQALAATGKTTTVINFAERLLEKEPESRILYLVFNRNAKDDVLERGMPDNVEVKTMDGVSYNAYKAMKPEITAKSFEADPAYIKPIKSNKERASYLGARGLVSNGEELTATDVYKRVSKAVDVFSISADGEIGPQHFSGLDNPRLEVTDEAILPELVGLAQKMWADMNTPRVPNSNGQKGTGMLPMSNNHVTKMWALTSPDLSTSEGVNIAMVDEAQDMNPVFAELLKKANGLQRIYIGDTNQAINAWRGADGGTLDSAYAKHVMPITDSFRFGKEIADKGNRFLKLLGKKERMTGRKTDKSGNPVNGVVGPIDNPTMILTRSNGGAIVATLETFQNGGQVFGSKNFKNDLDSFINNIEYFETGAVGKPYWTNTNGERMSSPPKVSKDLDGITNLAEFEKAVDDADNNRLNMLAKLLRENSIDELRAALKKIITDKKKLPKDRDSYVHIQTAHTSKGLESPRVKIWSDFRKPKRDGAGNLILPDEQELRLSYVAVTRAEEELDLGGLGWIMDYTSDTDGASDKLSSGANMLMPRLSGTLSNALINSTPEARKMRKEWKKRDSMSKHPSKRKGAKLSSGAKAQITENNEKIAELRKLIDEGYVAGRDGGGNPVYQNFPRQRLLDMYEEIKLLEGRNRRLEVEGEAPTALDLKTTSGRVIDIEKLAPEKRNTIQDIRDVSTSEEDFARKLDQLVDSYAKSGQNITTKRSKNESSNGTKISPSKLAEDDRLALAEITDPAERAKFIDELLEGSFYGQRIIAIPPKKKKNWMEEAGLISKA